MCIKSSTLFFTFSAQETVEELSRRLSDAGKMGIEQVIASYKTQGMEQARFDGTYFEALDRMVEACRRQEMRFWLEDYAPFPTGSANGAYEEPEHTEENKWFINERHLDLTGPIREAVIRVDSLKSLVYGKEIHQFAKVDPACRKLLGVVACRLKENPRNGAAPFLEEETAVLLSEKVKDGFLKWDVPEGRWRIFVLYTTYESSGRAFFMNLLSKASVALEIQRVHKPLYEHLKEELGKTWIGFFYDEPEIGNDGGEKEFDFFMLPGARSRQQTDCNVYAWSPEMPGEMERQDPDWIRNLPCLWYDGLGAYRDYRCRYMDAVTSLIRENYNGQVYAFCRERGIRYIGHVLEDENCHTRQGCGPGHYFRQQYYQDEAGIDVIAGQILPGRDGASSWYGVVNSDGEFYHYGLAKLASSEAHINPIKRNRAAAECFAMYGQQGLAQRKFLLDHLMVNGVNRMLLAELPSYEASLEYSRQLVEYTDRLCELLRTAEPVIKTAILYHAEAEWREGDGAQKFQKPGAALARHQISYDVIPADVFAFPERYHTKMDTGLSVNGHAYEALILPACGRLPEAVAEFVRGCAKTGFPVFFMDRIPEGLKETEMVPNIRCLSLEELAGEVGQAISMDISVQAEGREWLRCSHLKRGEKEYYLIHNEAPWGGMDCQVMVRSEGEVLEWDPMTGEFLAPRQRKTGDGRVAVTLSLGQYEMKVLLTSALGAEPENEDGRVLRIGRECPGKEAWELEFPDGHKIRTEGGTLPRPEDYVGYDFYGRLVYRTVFFGEDTLPEQLELGQVSDCCEVFLNGQSVGRRAAAPYRYHVGGAVRKGQNELTLEVYTSAGNLKSPVKIFGTSLDALTAVPYGLVEPMGITGPVRWLYQEEK